MSHAAPAAPASQPAQAPAGIPANFSNADVSGLQLTGLDQTQIMNLLRSLPGVVFKVSVLANISPPLLFPYSDSFYTSIRRHIRVPISIVH